MPARLRKEEMDVANRALHKSPFAVTQIELPQPQKLWLIAESLELRKPLGNIPSPGLKRRHIVSSDILQLD